MRNLILLLYVSLALVAGCGAPAAVRKYLSAEDEAVLELLDALKKKPNDAGLLNQLPDLYERAMSSRDAMRGYVLTDNPAGDRWVLWRRQLEASQYITKLVMALPAATNYIKNPRAFESQIADARQQAAEEYYNLGLEYLNYQNRPYAQKALDMFTKANREVAGYKDVNRLMRDAELMAQMVVVVNPVDYYRFSFRHWGFNEDYLQWQMIRDLNNRSYRNVRFYSDEEVRRLRLHPERVVDMRFDQLFISSPYTERRQYQRSAQIPVDGSTGGNQTKPTYTTVTATVFVTRRYINANASLECRIYDVPTRRDILYDRFPGRYNWVQETATYTGDQRALTQADWQLINNRFNQYPTCEEIAQQMIRDCYNQLLSRIQQGVSFDAR